MNPPTLSNDILKTKRIFLMGGPGGVGKTTLAAALGAKLAEEGFRTIVLTVDPAKRLAQALGLNGFSSEIQEIPLKNGKILYASMLDTQLYFDRVISKFALSDSQREKILNHRLYRIMVESLGGTHEYAAMERLLEFAKETDFEKIIVDTPPSQNSIDLLKAPERLSAFMDNKVIHWFQKKKGAFSFLKQGTQLAMKLLEKVFGADFLTSLSEVFNDLDGMQKGFHERNKEISSLLKSNSTAFFLTTYPSEVRFQESVEFMQELKNLQIPLSGLFINRVEPTPLPHKEEKNFYLTLRSEQMRWVKEFESLKIPFLVIEKQENLELSKLLSF